MSSVAKDNKDEDGLKPEKLEATFSSFNAFGGKCGRKFYNTRFLVARLKKYFCYQKLGFFKVIGDKKGGKTSEIFANNDSMETLEEIAEVVKLPMKFIHVTRNPFDNIATMTLRLASQRNNVREEGIKVIFVPCRGIQDSLVFWIPRRGYPDSRYWIPVFISGTWILDSNR